MFFFFISCLAENRRNPFDFVDGESELVSDFHVEYSVTEYWVISRISVIYHYQYRYLYRETRVVSRDHRTAAHKMVLNEPNNLRTDVAPEELKEAKLPVERNVTYDRDRRPCRIWPHPEVSGLRFNLLVAVSELLSPYRIGVSSGYNLCAISSPTQPNLTLPYLI